MIRLADISIQGSEAGYVRIVKSYHVDTEDEVFQAVASNTTYRGFRATGDFSAQNVEADTIAAGFYVDITFGTIEIEGDESDEYGGTAAKWDFNPSFEKEPIEKHPQIAVLIEDYDGQEDPDTRRVTFPRTLDRLPSNDRRGLLPKNIRDGEEIKNPAYGFSESGYIVMGGVASARFTTSSTSTVLSGVGKVFKSLPSNAPDYGVEDDRDWIKMPPRVSEVAEDESGVRYYEVEHSFMLSQPGGWPAGVYKFIEV